MSQLSEWIRSVYWDDASVRFEYLAKCKIEELFNVITYIRKLINKDYQIPQYNPYTFVPNNSLSGTGGCAEIGCKTRRANRFATFSAIYADDVFLQLELVTDEHFDMLNPNTMDAESIRNLKYSFNCDMTVIMEYLPLIEKGIVHIEPIREHYCKECFQKLLLKRDDLVDYSPIVDFVKDNVIIEVIEYNHKREYVVVELKNIDDYFDGESLVYMIRGESFYKLSNSDRKIGIKNVKKECWKSLIENFVEEQFVSSCYYTNYCRESNAKLITSNPSDGLFAAITRGKESAKKILETHKNLPQYDMPFIQKISIEDALKLREVEHEAFNRYRIALDKSIKEQCKTSSQIEWIDIYNDILYPEFAYLDLKLKNIKAGNYIKTFGNILVVAGTITAGLMTGILPMTVPGIIGGTIGTTGVTGLATHALTQKNNSKIDLRENNYYYLWRLTK